MLSVMTGFMPSLQGNHQLEKNRATNKPGQVIWFKWVSTFDVFFYLIAM